MFVTHAQNFEDVLLNRALADVENGFYIDVGTCDPVAESVTLAFYERGWSGINIEPMPESFARISSARDRDINLNVAVEDVTRDAIYWAVDGGNGLSLGSEDVARIYERAGHTVSQVPVDTTTLRDICERHVKTTIHFLKIDTEGGEGKVVAGADFSRFRPWIILLESAGLGQVHPPRDEWHEQLLKAGYEFACFDGLNCFYLAQEHAGRLRDHFVLPPNIFDGFVSAGEWRAREVTTEIGELFDVTVPGNDVELLERARALLQDRNDVANEAAALRDQLVAVGQREVECARVRDELATETASLRARVTAVEQQREHDIATLRTDNAKGAEALSATQAQVVELLESRSWKLTRPLRAIFRLVRR